MAWVFLFCHLVLPAGPRRAPPELRPPGVIIDFPGRRR